MQCPWHGSLSGAVSSNVIVTWEKQKPLASRARQSRAIHWEALSKSRAPDVKIKSPNLCKSSLWETLPTKVHLVKAMVFPSGYVWMWELDYKESWAPKNWWFWTVVLEKTLESPLDCRGSNQSILKEISPEYSLEGLMLKLKLQYYGHLMQRTDLLEKILMLWDWKREEKGMTDIGWHHQLNGHEFE